MLSNADEKNFEKINDYEILRSLSGPFFDNIVLLASQFCKTPIAFISTTNQHLLTLKACIGLKLQETSREHSFCKHTQAQTAAFVVPDASQDSRFTDYSLVSGPAHIRFYAGIPLINPQGQALGSLAILDTNPRSLASTEEQFLRSLAKQLMLHWELQYTEYKLREQNRTLALEKKKFENLVYAMNQSTNVAITNLQGIISFANDKFCSTCGYTATELIGQDHRILSSGVHSKEFFKDFWQTIVEGGIWNGEICNKRKDGSLYWSETTIVPLTDEQGHVEQFIAIRYETTKRKLLENHLIESRELERKASNAKSDFLSNMSHEIRTPLNGIIGMTDILKDSPLTKDQQEQVDVIVKSGQILLSIINDILDFAKIESGKMLLELAPVDISSLIKEIMAPHQFACNAKHLIFEHQIDTLSSFLLADAGRLGQIINNLLSNAIKFTQYGKITLNVSKVTETADEIKLSFSVEDTGIGINKKSQQYLFQAFTQAEQLTARKYGGTGLGLSIVKKLVEMMNGSIYWKSEENKGSIFTVDFTFKKAEGLLLQRGSESNETMPPSFDHVLTGRILVAEDNMINQNLILKMLKTLGCQTAIAHNGFEVIEALKMQVFDLILMDCRMPEMDGYEATKAVRNSSKQKGIKIIAVTANASKEDKNLCLAAGMNGFISKPITKEKLYTALAPHLKKNDPTKTQKKQELLGKVDYAFIAELHAMSDESDADFFIKQTEVFTEHTKALIAKLGFFITEKDSAEIKIIAHSLQGSALSFGALAVAKLSKDIEALIEIGSFAEASRLFKELELELSIFYDFLQRENKKYSKR